MRELLKPGDKAWGWEQHESGAKSRAAVHTSRRRGRAKGKRRGLAWCPAVEAPQNARLKGGGGSGCRGGDRSPDGKWETRSTKAADGRARQDAGTGGGAEARGWPGGGGGGDGAPSLSSRGDDGALCGLRAAHTRPLFAQRPRPGLAHQMRAVLRVQV